MSYYNKFHGTSGRAHGSGAPGPDTARQAERTAAQKPAPKRTKLRDIARPPVTQDEMDDCYQGGKKP